MRDKVLKGKEGWLFLKNDANRVLDQIQGKLPLSEAHLKEWEVVLNERLEHARKYSYQYKYLILPNSHCVYDRFLPDDILISENRPAIQLAKKFPDIIEYPLDLLKSYPVPLYYKTDTHWNTLGQVEVLNTLLGPLTGQVVAFEQTLADHCGDLGNKLIPPISAPSAEITYEASSRIIYDNKCNNNGRIFVTQNQKLNLPIGLAFGDSMFTNAVKLLGEYFSYFYFFHVSVFDRDIISQIRPDIVLSENIERFIFRINSNSYQQELYKRSFSHTVLTRDYLKMLPPPVFSLSGLRKRLDTGIDYAMHNAYVYEVKKMGSFTEFENKKVEVLNANALYHYLPRKNMEPLGPGWSGRNPRNKIYGWAFGYVQDGHINPDGLAISLNSLLAVNNLNISIFENVINAIQIQCDSLKQLWTSSFLTKDLNIYTDTQEVYFSLDGLILRHGHCYLVTVEADNYIGCASSHDDLPQADYLFRGYFITSDKAFYRPVAGTQSIARRFVFKDGR